MAYVDGFVLPVPRKKLAAYRRISRLGGRIWKDHGALEYRECVLDDPKAVGMLSFPKMTKAKKGEVVLFSWITYRSKAHRKRVLALVMKDERLSMSGEAMPFDVRRMAYGGFKVLVDF